MSIILLAAIGLDLAETFDEVENSLGLGADNTVDATPGTDDADAADGRQLVRQSPSRRARAHDGASPSAQSAPALTAGALARSVRGSAANEQLREIPRPTCHPSIFDARLARLRSRGRPGQTMIEYAGMALLVSIAAILILAAIGLDIAEGFDAIENALGLGARQHRRRDARHRRRGRRPPGVN